MNPYDYRQEAAAQWFLSNISLDGNIYGHSRFMQQNNDGMHGFIATDGDDDDDDKSAMDFVSKDQITFLSRKSDLFGWENDMRRKNVCFDEVFCEPSLDYHGAPQRLASAPDNQYQLSSTTSGLPQTESEPFSHSNNDSFRYVISTVNWRRPPLVVASVIPLSRDPLMQSGIPKGLNGAQSGGVISHHSVPEMPGALLSTIFRHANNHTTRSGSLVQDKNLASTHFSAVKPLSHSKPVDSVDRSYAHFLTSRKLLAQLQNLNCRSRHRAQTVGGDESPAVSTVVIDNGRIAAPTDACTSGGGQYQSRSQTLSCSSVTSASNNFDKIFPLQDNIVPVGSISCISSSENLESIQAVIYDDPLVTYNPLLLDDPMKPRVTNRRVFPFQGYMTSILGYRRGDEHKKNINREFHQRFPNIQLSLTKMRSIKLNMLAIVLRMHLELWIVAHAYVLFEKMILKLLVCKSNRKLCAGAALLISAKLNDLKGPALPSFIQEIESEFRISHRDLLNMEMAAFIGLEFCILPSPAEAQPHFTHIQKSLGIVSIPRCQTNPLNSREDDHFYTSFIE